MLGVAGTGIILALGLRGMRDRLAAYGLPGIVLWIWVISSVVEELFCRGWFQTLAAGGESDPPGERAVTPSPVECRAVRRHAPAVAVKRRRDRRLCIDRAIGDGLGFVCAEARPRTGSLRPAIAAHVLFNGGGFVGGVIYTIAYRVATGHLPPA